MSLETIISEIRDLSVEERRRLMQLIADTLDEPPAESARPEHSILELAGLGAEIWAGIDPQAYVDQLRDEWDRRP